MSMAAAAARDDEHLIGLIYDAPYDDALWTTVLEALAERVGAHPANLIEIDVIEGHGGGCAARAPDDIIASYFADWSQLNPLVLVDDLAGYSAGWTPRILRDTDWIDRRELERGVYYNEFLLPLEAAHNVFMRLSLDGPFLATINFGRPVRRGAFEDGEIATLGRFHPHLVRADRVRRALTVRQSELDKLDTFLESTPQALCFLDERLTVRCHTAAADALLRGNAGLRLRGGRLHAGSWADQATLDAMLAVALRGGNPPAPLTLAATPGAALTVAAARMGERSVTSFAGGRGVLVSITATEATMTDTERMRRRYGLTHAEARLTEGLLAGESLRAFAERHAVSINTVRNQLATIFDKTGCRRQQDLLRLLAAEMPPPGPLG